ncbi:MAG: serpin family protein, partial [Muribaculaceae bacterium]|nr:serpin family protein [Muribaculaceae bacterium]
AILPENRQTPVQEENVIKEPLEYDSELHMMRVAAKETTLDIVKAIISKTGDNENMIISPLTLYWSMSMIANGVTGEAQNELLSFLHILDKENGDINTINNSNGRFLDNLPYLDPQVTLKLANSIWVDKEFGIRPEFLSLMDGFYKAQTFRHDFSNEDVRTLINSWVSENTENLIPRLLTEHVDGPMTIINTMYFNAPWHIPFDPRNTTKENFTCSDGSVTAVDMMHHETMEAGLLKYPDVLLLNLRFGMGHYTMTFALPDPGVDLSSIISSLDLTALEQLAVRDNIDDTEVYIPKFSIQDSYNLNEPLNSLGVNGIFSPSTWNGLTDSKQNLYIAKLVHSATFSINEQGGEAAGSVGSQWSSGFGHVDPFEERIFRADRPFLFYITDNNWGLPIMIGCINKL